MAGTQNEDEMPILVRWNYSREEWKIFMRWKKMKEGFFSYVLYRLSPTSRFRIPEITITNNLVSIDHAHESFNNTERRFRRIRIHEAGAMNVMEIAYQRNDAYDKGLNEIHIPVPKGRLKEAISVEEKLNAINDIIQRD